MAKFVTKEKMVGKLGFLDMVNAAKEKGFVLVGDVGEHVKYECPACKKVMTERAALKKSKPLVRSFTTARHFINKAKRVKMTACPCGYRKVNTPAAGAAPPTNPINAATRGMVEGARAVKLKMDEKCTAIKNDGERCTYRALRDGRCGIHQKVTVAQQYQF